MKRDLYPTYRLFSPSLNRKAQLAILPLLLAVVLPCLPATAQVGVSDQPGVSPSKTTLTQTPLLIWKVGSPHNGDTPDNILPQELQLAARKAGYRLTIETFPARGFADRFFNAVAQQTEPDILAIDNYGVIDVDSTQLGDFASIGSRASVRRSLRLVDESFKALGGSGGGWQFLITTSRNHNAAKALALNEPECAPDVWSDKRNLPEQEIAAIKETAATASQAYLNGDLPRIRSISDPTRLGSGRRFGDLESQVNKTQVCAITGNQRLAFVKTVSSFEVKNGQLGRKTILAVLRKEADKWRLLTITDDPRIRDLEYVLPDISRALINEAGAAAILPATLLNHTKAAIGQRFGEFTWRPGASTDVFCEIAEFEYENATRLFIFFPVSSPVGRVSEGNLWSTDGPWHWRIWTIARNGRLSLSEAQSFYH
jgi:hypothetical protein